MEEVPTENIELAVETKRKRKYWIIITNKSKIQESKEGDDEEDEETLLSFF